MTEMNQNAQAKSHHAAPDAGRDYFVRREAQERALVDRATDPVARRVHAELAKRYAALIGTVA